jgi:DNA-binding NarL/FixJ family response regulator
MKLLIVDDHVLFREGLAAILRSEPDLEIVGLAGSVEEAIEMDLQTQPDVVLMDFELRDGSGLDATRAILTRRPECKVIFLSIFESDDKFIAAVRAGANGYLLKNMRPTKLIVALRRVMQGESVLSRKVTLRVMQDLARTK